MCKTKMQYYGLSYVTFSKFETKKAQGEFVEGTY